MFQLAKDKQDQMNQSIHPMLDCNKKNYMRQTIKTQDNKKTFIK